MYLSTTCLNNETKLSFAVFKPLSFRAEKYRFTTYERLERPGLMVRKSSGASEAFDHEKLMYSIRISVGKYFDSDSDIQNLVSEVENRIYASSKGEVSSRLIGETILEVLSDINEMAYVRFASVFRGIKTLDDLEELIKEQKKKRQKNKKGED